MTFLLGTIAWVLIWVLIYSFKNNFYYEALRTAFITIILADAAVMAYLYKSYYGRFITNELGEDPSTTEWKYNKETKKYERKNIYDKRRDDYEQRKAFNNYLNTLEQENKKINIDKVTLSIILNKQKLRSANKIQTWWRSRQTSRKDDVELND